MKNKVARKPKFTKDEMAKAAILYLDAILGEMISPDVLGLAAGQAVRRMTDNGVDQKRAVEMITEIHNGARGIESQIPMHRMFWG